VHGVKQRREIHFSDERTARSAMRRAEYVHRGYRAVKARRVDPMTADRGYVVTIVADDRKG
jgi:hypothetical protein